MNNNIEKIKLDNGLFVCLDNSSKNHNVYINFIARYGGMDSHFKFNDKEYSVTCGMAHFLEHLLIEKSKHGNLMKTFGDHFFTSNGLTSFNKTQFYVVATKDYEYALNTLLDAIINPVFDKKDIENTKPAIIEEIRMRSDQFGRLVLKNVLENIFYDNDYSNNLGSIEEIENINYETVKMCYNAFYNPSNMCLFITGNFDKKIVKKIINKVCKSFKDKGKLEKLFKNESSNVKSIENTIPCKVKSEFLDMAFKINLKDYKWTNYEMYNYLSAFINLNFADKSKFSKNLILDGVVKSDFGASVCCYNDIFILEISAFVLDKEEFTKRIMDVLNKNHNKDRESFELSFTLEKLRLTCEDKTAFAKGNELIITYLQEGAPSYETIKDLDKFNFEEYIKFIDSIDFSHYVINNFIPE